MIENSFIFLNNFGYKRERLLWQKNILFWDDFLTIERIKGISKITKLKNDRKIMDAKRALRTDNLSFFTKHFPRTEFWRFYNYLDEETLFLDIETDSFGNLTVISLFNGEECKTFIRGFNLNFSLLRRIINNSKMLVTFNGSSFDIPILKHYIKFNKDIFHFDLRHAFVRLGYNMGLKQIEKLFGVKRGDSVAVMTGFDALQLWKCFKKEHNKECLKLLIEYNRFDAVNLKPLADIAFKRLYKNIFENYIK